MPPRDHALKQLLQIARPAHARLAKMLGRGDYGLQQDLSQAARIAVWRKIDKALAIEESGERVAFLTTVSRNAMLDHLRSEFRTRNVYKDPVVFLDQTEQYDDTADTYFNGNALTRGSAREAEKQPGPDVTLEQRQALEAVDSMPPVQRQVAAGYALGMSSAEVAEMIGVSWYVMNKSRQSVVDTMRLLVSGI